MPSKEDMRVADEVIKQDCKLANADAPNTERDFQAANLIAAHVQAQVQKEREKHQPLVEALESAFWSLKSAYEENYWCVEEVREALANHKKRMEVRK